MRQRSHLPGRSICSSTYDFAADATSHWHDGDQTVAISASGGSALTIHYSADGGDSWTSIAGRNATIKVSASGAHHFLYYASDASGSGATCDAGRQHRQDRPVDRSLRRLLRMGQ